ncbi:MAG: hypothetical protein LUD12_10385 [Lachnospiraceae bacterium]|nr:hypothetical protein [Lachnospiraceae bacterium]
MVFSENIYFLILFSLPAALNIIYNAHIRQVPIIQKDKSVEIAECIVFCMAVLFLNMTLMKTEVMKFGEYILLSETERAAFAETENFEYLSFMVHYFLLNLITSAVVIVLWYSVGQWIFRKAKNIFNKASGRDKELKYSDVWRNLFETNEHIDVSECIIKIERGGRIVTAGSILEYPSPTEEKKDIALYNTESVMELFEDDKGKDVSERLFPYADAVYYDIETDTLIKFYNDKKYEEYYKRKESGE